jgi:hypothetical protein
MRWRYGRRGDKLTLTDHNDVATTTNQQSTTREIRKKTVMVAAHQWQPQWQWAWRSVSGDREAEVGALLC